MTSARTTPLRCIAFALTTLSLAACGGGGGGSEALTPTGPDTAQRTQAAATTAANNSSCVAVKPFYWEIGDKAGLLASGSVNFIGSLLSYTASTVVNIASASKWLYGASPPSPASRSRARPSSSRATARPPTC